MESQKSALEVEKEQLIIKRDQLVAELDQFKHENELTVARLERQKEALDQKLQQLEKGALTSLNILRPL